MAEAPQSVRLLLAGTFLFAAVACGGLSIPLIRGRVRMNRWYGVRIGKSFKSSEHWYAMNRFGGWQLLAYAAALALVAVVLLRVSLAPTRWYFWLLMLSPLWLLVPVVWRITAYSRRLP